MNKHINVKYFLILILLISLPNTDNTAASATKATQNTTDQKPDFAGTWVSMSEGSIIELTPLTYSMKFSYKNEARELYGDIISYDTEFGHITFKYSRRIYNGKDLDINDDKYFMKYQIKGDLLKIKIDKSEFPISVDSTPYCNAKYYMGEDSGSVIKGSASTLGWDLTFRTILKQNSIGMGEWIVRWLMIPTTDQGDPPPMYYKSPITDTITTWKDDKIVSSVLLEYPAFHAGEHLTLWMVRTQSNLYLWEYVKGKPKIERKLIDTEIYDREFQNIFSLDNSKKLSIEDVPDGSIPGYFAILSSFSGGKSKQIFLNTNDFLSCTSKDCKNLQPGKLAVTIFSAAGYEVGKNQKVNQAPKK
jgi:hypothetical protein